MTIAACSYEASTGALTELHSLSTVPSNATGNDWSTAEVEVAPSGNYVYVSNRGHNSIASFAIDSSSGRLTPLGHIPTGGRTPRNFAIDPTGSYLFAANELSGNVALFNIDASTGRLSPAKTDLKIDVPVCIVFLPAGK